MRYKLLSLVALLSGNYFSIFGMELPFEFKPSYKILAGDDKEFTVSKDFIKSSKVLKYLIEDINPDAIKLSDMSEIKPEDMSKIIELFDIYSKNQAIASKLQAISFEDLQNLIKNVNYLDIPVLLDPIADGLAYSLTSETLLNNFEASPIKAAYSWLYIPIELQKIITFKILNLKNFIDKATPLSFTTIIDKSNVVAIKSVSFSPDSNHLATGLLNGNINIWDITTGAIVSILTGHSNCISSIAYSPDGKQLASCSQDKTIKIWDTNTWELEHTLTGYTWRVSSVSYSPDSRYLASDSYNTIKIWDTNTGELVHTLTGHIYQVTQ